MIRVYLNRKSEVGDATFGVLSAEGKEAPICLTLEELWVDKNHDGLSDHDVSRIPAGLYRMFRRLSPKRGYEVFQLEGVPGRQDVQVHKGNTTADTLGCILVGTEIGELEGKPAVLHSSVAFSHLMAELPNDEYLLHVIDIAAPTKVVAEQEPVITVEETVVEA